MSARTDSPVHFALIAIGTSLGGLRALRSVLSALPRNFPVPVAVVQHRTPDAGDPLQLVLQELCALKVLEVEDKAMIESGYVYLAPPNYHLLVEGDHFTLSTEDAELYARPSINALLQTAAEAYGPRVVGVILTGTGHDGALGLAALRRAGGLAVVERPATAEMAEMPQAAADAAGNAIELAVEDIGPFLARLIALQINDEDR
ncbi:chemotaxis protein CheB [Devosia sp.]|uniref:chemotaxis protein CheB n=1 Tax=Devosia sp. TaxID=1871048 RepID=UPI002FC95710